jgi:hypothetical protein
LLYPLSYRGSYKKYSTCQQLKPETEFYKKEKSGKSNSLCKEYFRA